MVGNSQSRVAFLDRLVVKGVFNIKLEYSDVNQMSRDGRVLLVSHSGAPVFLLF